MSQTAIIRERLLKAIPIESTGYWEIVAEDENADWAGSHFQRRLLIVKGSYEQAVEIALKTTGFVYWGAGGDVNPVKVVDVSKE